MTETQNYPTLPPTAFRHGDPFHRKLPPLSTLTHHGSSPLLARPDYGPHAPQSQLPAIHQSLPHHQPTYGPPPRPAQPSRRTYLPVSKPGESISPGYFPRPELPYSPQQYGSTISPQIDYSPRGPPRLVTDPQYRHNERQRWHHTDDHASPVDKKLSGFASNLSSPSYSGPYPPRNTAVHSSLSPHNNSAPSSAHVNYPDAISHPSIASRPGPPIARSLPTEPIHPGIEDNPYDYRLIIRQQPEAARACGFGERDRRVIDPPPIIQLEVTDKKTGAPVHDELRYGLHVLHCSLWDEQGTQEQTSLTLEQKRPTRRLMGQLVASPSVAKDEHNKEGCFFCFPDLSCRTHGRYTLRFVLMKIDPADSPVGKFFPVLTEILSGVFQVYTAKDFPGMQASSPLTRALKVQGCNIQVKKGNEKSQLRKRITVGDDDDGDENKRRRKD